MNLQEVINEANLLVPSGYTDADKVAWLNAINREFFDVVKVPKTEFFSAYSASSTYTMTQQIKEKDIDKLMIGHLKYRSLNYDDVQPGQNWFTFEDTTRGLVISPTPSKSVTGLLRYRLAAVNTYFVETIGTQTPDAPTEYHWIYALGLAEYIAKANEEDAKAANYGGQYRSALQVAAQNFQKEGAT